LYPAPTPEVRQLPLAASPLPPKASARQRGAVLIDEASIVQSLKKG
jgi:hypothetical protein